MRDCPKPDLCRRHSRRTVRTEAAWPSVLAIIAIALIGLTPRAAMADPDGLSVPRYVSLAYDEVNLRVGPMRIYPVKWQYQRRGLPVEVINERDDWREVRDHDGVQGWMHQSQLSTRRSIIVTAAKPIALRKEPIADGYILAFLATGVIAMLDQCQATSCQVHLASTAGEEFTGWLPRQALWGIGSDD